MKTPIFWLQLRHQPMQTISAVVGIAFITILLFSQIGFRTSFLTTLVHLPSRLNADIVMFDSSLTTILRSTPFSHHRLYQALADDDVVAVDPLYLAVGQMRDPAGSPNFLELVQFVGVPLGRDILRIAEFSENEGVLYQRRSLLIDTKSRADFAPVIASVQSGGVYRTEIRAGPNQKAVRIEALFALGSNTSANAHVIGSDVTFMDVHRRDRSEIDLGLVKLRPGADANDVAARLSKALPPDVKVLTKEKLIQSERAFYEFETPIGVIFRFGLGGAIGVGVVILYQILFQMMSKYIRDYATLKAIGFSENALKGVVLKSALFLAAAGFIPGVILSYVMYSVVGQATALDFRMTPDIVVLVFATICLICVVSALLAIRKLRDADPADLFG